MISMNTKDYLGWAEKNVQSRIQYTNFKKELNIYYKDLITEIRKLKQEIEELQKEIRKEKTKVKT